MFLWAVLIVGATLFVAYANGANDNFKGVATLFGSGMMDYRKALWWATSMTLAGSLAAFFLATRLISIFHGKGLVPASLSRSHPFLAAVILGAALTVFAATKIGMPISTTHSLTGALFGAGFAALGFELGFNTLLSSFFLPLLISPLAALAVVLFAYPLARSGFRFAGLSKETCICVGSGIAPIAVTADGHMMSQSTKSLSVLVDRETECMRPLSGALFGMSAQSLIDLGHFLSAGAVSFARGLNDTPKIVAIGLAAGALDLPWAVGFVAFIMALGGLLSARKVAETMSRGITRMEPDEGFVANLVTSSLVVFASKWGLPVSTTHVSCGALFGIGVLNGKAQWRVMGTVLLAWVLTLPLAGISAGVIYAFLSRWQAA